MENEGKGDDVVLESEDFPDEFQCCVCLDIMYKPVVLACGHISCFWCVFKAMDSFRESYCPVCRHPYNYFPRVCRLLHYLLLKLYPSAYKRRERQVKEEEKGSGYASPQFEERLLDFNCNEALDVPATSSPLSSAVQVEPNSTCGDNSLVQDSSKITLPYAENNTALATTSNSRNTNEANCMVEDKEPNGTRKQVIVADLQCAVCRQLLFRPVVLNCGHVYCEACTNTLQESVCKCPVCQSPHPNGFPNVCLILEHFLEKHFPEEYSARKQSSAPLQKASPSGSSADEPERKAQCSTGPTNACSSSSSGQRAQVHCGAGCDYCGMCPIIGKRYKCKDCLEKIGFDLCEGCYNSSSKLPGRFNQQHTQEHQFIEISSPSQSLIFTLEPEHPGWLAVSVFDPENLQEVLTVRESSNGAEHELENPASLDLSDDDLLDPDDAVSSHNSFNNGSRDTGDDSAG